MRTGLGLAARVGRPSAGTPMAPKLGKIWAKIGYIVLVYGIDHAPQSRNEIVPVKAHQGLERCLLVPALGGNGCRR